MTAILKNRYDVKSPPMFVRLLRNFHVTVKSS